MKKVLLMISLIVVQSEMLTASSTEYMDLQNNMEEQIEPKVSIKITEDMKKEEQKTDDLKEKEKKPEDESSDNQHFFSNIINKIYKFYNDIVSK